MQMTLGEDMARWAHTVVRDRLARSQALEELRHQTRGLREEAQAFLREARGALGEVFRDTAARLEQQREQGRIEEHRRQTGARRDRREAARERAARAEQTAAELSRLKDVRTDLGRELRRELRRSREQLTRLRQSLASRTRSQARTRRQALEALRAEVSAGRTQARRDLGATRRERTGRALRERRERRQGASFRRLEVHNQRAAAREALEGLSDPAASGPAQSAGAPARAEEIPNGLHEQVLALVNSHPTGIRLAAMEGELCLPRVRLGRVCKDLLEEGRLVKEGKLYFPIR